MPVRPAIMRPPASPSLHTREYKSFRGVDFSTDPAKIDPYRSPYALNIVSDAGGYPEKRTGWRVLHTFAGGSAVNGLHFFVTGEGALVYVAHVGTSLYTWDETEAEPVSIHTEMADARSVSFVHNGVLYLLDGMDYLSFDGANVEPVEGYIPTTVIGRAPAGGGTVLEAVNLLQPGRKNSFIGDGGTKEVCRLQISTTATASGYVHVTLNGVTVNIAVLNGDSPAVIAGKVYAGTFTGWDKQLLGDTVLFTAQAVGEKSDATFDAGATGVLGNMITLTQGTDAVTAFQLDAAGLDATAVTAVVAGVAKVETTDFTVNRATGVVTFNAAPESGAGVDNVVITFYKTVYEEDGVTPVAERIRKCRIAAWFGMGNDSRAFLSGNPDFPNMDWQSGLYDPTYFPDTGYTRVGADSSAIMGYLKQFNDLLVIKEDNEQDATIYKRTAELDAEGTPVFPLRQGVAGVGAISRHAFGVLRDDPLFLAKEGVFALTTGFGDVTQQRYVQERSYYVKARLTKEAGLQNAVAAVWNGLYVLCVNGRAYVADSRQKTGKSSTETAGYEWYYWDNVPNTPEGHAFVTVSCLMVYADKLYFGTSDGRICMFSTLGSVYRFADDGQPITAVWSTIADADGDWMRYKTMPRKGSGVMIKPYSRSSVKVYVRTDRDFGSLAVARNTSIFDFEDMDFEAFTFETLDSPQVIPLNRKVKRYKTLQVIVQNDAVNEGFGVYGIVKRFTFGNFVKE